MVFVPEHFPRVRLGLLIVALGVGYAMIAPVGLMLLPLAGLVLISQRRSAVAVFVATVAGMFGLIWLTRLGAPSDQFVRAVAVAGTISFVAFTLATHWSVVHRAVTSIVVTAASVAMYLALFGVSWDSIKWWVEYRAAFLQMRLLQIWLASLPEPFGGVQGVDSSATQVERALAIMPGMMADLFPATLALQMLVGFAIAAFIANRVGAGERKPGTFRTFRFTEHLGWLAVLGLMALLLGGAGIRGAAANVVLVLAALYALRGAAVAWDGLRRRGGPSPFTVIVLVLATIFLWPVVLTATVALGVADTGMNLRDRWQTAQ